MNARRSVIAFVVATLAVPAFACGSEPVCATSSRDLLARKAASGDNVAAATLGMLSELGICGEPSLTDAKAWYLVAASRGDAHMQMRLGNLYYHSGPAQGGAREEAYRWFEKAADNGLPGGMVMLANRYMLGEGIEKDLAMAYYWFAKANGGELPDRFASLKAQMSEDELARAQRMLEGSATGPDQGGR